MGTLATIVQIVLIILKACNIEPFASMLWSNPLLWIPTMIIAFGVLIVVASSIIAAIMGIKNGK